MGEGSTYDVVLVQEHHTKSHEELRELASRLARHGWHSTWTPATASKNGGTSGGTGIVWVEGLPITADVVQPGLVRAQGRTTLATLTWPGLEEVHFVSLYMHTGGKLDEENTKLLYDLAAYLSTTGGHHWIGGDFQLDSEVLLEHEWQRAIGGAARAGHPAVGTCTVATPATNIDYHWVSRGLEHMATAATTDTNEELRPHRPVWAVLQLEGGSRSQCNMCSNCRGRKCMDQPGAHQATTKPKKF